MHLITALAMTALAGCRTPPAQQQSEADVLYERGVGLHEDFKKYLAMQERDAAIVAGAGRYTPRGRKDGAIQCFIKCYFRHPDFPHAADAYARAVELEKILESQFEARISLPEFHPRPVQQHGGRISSEGAPSAPPNESSP